MDKARPISMRRVCRMRCGLTPGDPKDQPAAVAAIVQPMAAALPVQVPIASSSSGSATMSLDLLVDQTLKVPLIQLPAFEVRRMFVDYETKFGGPPSDESEPTATQLSALGQVLSMDVPPYVDYALWGPHGRRLLHKLTFVALVPLGDGTSQRKELPGPASFDQWWP